MKVKNVSARLHWVGAVMCVPGEITEVDDMYASAIDKTELMLVDEPVAYAEPVEEPTKVPADKPKTTRRRKSQ
ncbi:hypothetical protein [Nocardia mangyaensis]|uniref:hypothetical protein n=1 Tax=Nocardia mangyaensis TaxID=2213200 RepID=UPI0026757F72|nr:hypothetical protein [Nocardia mangyaensis]MDO3651399.1 hypothetical protein [Nocardia mangyaensis]